MAAKKRRRDERRPKGVGSVYPIKNRAGTVIAHYAALKINGRVERRRADTPEAAEARLAELRELRRKGIDVGSGAQPLADWLPVWYRFQVQRGKLKPRSLADYLRMIEQYLLPKLGSARLDALRQVDIQNFVFGLSEEIRAYYARKADEREAAGKRPGPRHEGTATVRRAAYVLKMALKLAVTRKLIPESPYYDIELPEAKDRSVEPPTAEQVGAFLASVEGERLEALWHLYALLGLRLGEGLGLRWADYDPQARTLAIRNQVQRMDRHGETPTHLIDGTPKRAGSVRVLPCPAACCTLLDALRRAQLELRMRRADTWVDNDLIFCNRDGGRLWPRHVEERWRLLWERAGLPSVNTLHDLRKSVATMLDEADVTETQKAAILGHTKKTQTQRYITARLDAMRRVLERVAERVLGKMDDSTGANAI
jgi:integrase